MTKIYDFDRQQELKAKLKEAEKNLLYWKKEFEFVVTEGKKLKAELEAAKKELQEYYDLTDVKNKMIELMANEIDPRVLYFDSDHAVEVTETVDGIIERFRAEAEKEGK